MQTSIDPFKARLLGAVLLASAGLGATSSLAFDEQYRLRSDSITTGAGNAVAHNIAVQTIDPWPRSARKPYIDVDGERLEIAIERYKANKSIPPVGLSTQSIITPSSGSGSN